MYKNHSRESQCHTTRQEMSGRLWIPTFPYRMHNSLQPACIPSATSPVQSKPSSSICLFIVQSVQRHAMGWKGRESKSRRGDEIFFTRSRRLWGPTSPLIFVLFYVFLCCSMYLYVALCIFMLLYVFLCFSMYFYVALCIFMLIYVFLCFSIYFYVDLCIFMLLYVFLCCCMYFYVALCICTLLYVFLCCSMYFCVVLCIFILLYVFLC